MDALGITSVNFSRLIHTGASPDDEPYLVADEAQKVYYVPDSKHIERCMVVHVNPRDLYDMRDEYEDYDASIETTQLVPPVNFGDLVQEDDEQLPLTREHEDGDE